MEHWYIGFSAKCDPKKLLDKVSNLNESFLSGYVCYERKTSISQYWQEGFLFFIGINSEAKGDLCKDKRHFLSSVLGLRDDLPDGFFYSQISSFTTEEILVSQNNHRVKLYQPPSLAPTDPFAYIDEQEEDYIPSAHSEKLEHLLYLLSVREMGTWQAYKELYHKLIGDDKRERSIIRNLALLGHIEFLSGGKKWIAAPTCLVQPDTASLQNGVMMFLAGRRSAMLLRELESSRDIQFTYSNLRGGPQRVCLYFENEAEAKKFARKHRIHFAGQIAKHMALRLPKLRKWELDLPQPTIIPSQYRLQRWAEHGGWEVFDGIPKESGLYEVEPLNEKSGELKRTLYYDAKKKVWRRADWYGLRYLALIRTGHPITIHYSSARQIALISQEHRLPYIYERALVLASGVLPNYVEHDGQKYLSYSELSEETVQRIAQKAEAQIKVYEE